VTPGVRWDFRSLAAAAGCSQGGVRHVCGARGAHQGAPGSSGGGNQSQQQQQQEVEEEGVAPLSLPLCSPAGWFSV